MFISSATIVTNIISHYRVYEKDDENEKKKLHFIKTTSARLKREFIFPQLLTLQQAQCTEIENVDKILFYYELYQNIRLLL